MQKKNIFKTVALAMLMPAMLLTTACSSEVDVANINNEPTVKKGYALPVTVSATRGGDATRATFDGSKLNFSTGDKLFVYGSATAAGSFAGELTWQSGGTFSGTIYTESPYEDTADALFTAASAGENLTATLLPNGYDANSFLSSTTDIAYDDRLTVSYSNAFVASETAKATGVEQLSLEQASTYSNGFELAPQCAILNFTISGLEAGAKDVTLNVTPPNGDDYTVTGSVTPTSGVATFAIGVPVDANIKEMSNNLTVGTHTFTLSSSTTFAARKIYNIARNAIPGALIGQFSVSATKQVYFSKGNLRYASGTWSFFEHQYDYYTSYSADAWDKFGWSTSATTYGMNISGSDDDYSGDFVDWGATMGTGWSTLSKNEWLYLFNTRSGSTVNGTAEARYTEATINNGGTGVNGVILFPDGATFADGEATWGTINAPSAWGTEYTTTCTTAQWTALEAKGCVFLPAAGYRDEEDVDVDGDRGYYWSSWAKDDKEAYYVYFSSEDLIVENFTDRYNGMSVRLVRDVAATAPANKLLSAAAAEDIGKVVGADGKIYANVAAAQAASTTACAIIAYVGTETAESQKHGLAIAMKDAAAGSLLWKPSSGSEDNPIRYTGAASAIEAKESGSALSADKNSDTWPAFKAALANSITEDLANGISAAAPASGTSGWFLPSLYQWNMIVKGLSGQSADLSTNNNAYYNASSLNTKIEAVGGTGLQQNGYYWLSTEVDGNQAWAFRAEYGYVYIYNKSTSYCLVRSVFAF